MLENAANLRAAPALLSCVARSPVVHSDRAEHYQPRQPRLPLSPLRPAAGRSPLGRLALADGCPRSPSARLLLVILRGPVPILRFPVSCPAPKKGNCFPPHTLSHSFLNWAIVVAGRSFGRPPSLSSRNPAQQVVLRLDAAPL